MDDKDLRNLLLETCPVRPGQEARAWNMLKDRLAQNGAPRSRWHWLYYPTWRGLAVALVALAMVPLGSYLFLGSQSDSLATANSQSPGIYATSFYSRSAKAQVVWLNGLGPASNQPTYLDPTTVVSEEQPAQRGPLGDPNSF